MTAPSTLHRLKTREPAARDTVEVHRLSVLGGLDLVSATYVRHSFSPHFHETFAVELVTRGACVVGCRGATYLLRPGHMVVMAPGEVHTGHQIGDVGWSSRMLYAPAAAVAGALAGAGPRGAEGVRFRSPVVDDPALASAFLALHDDLRGSTCRFDAETRTVDFLTTLFTAYRACERDPTSTRHANRMGAVRDYLAAHISEAVTLATLARVAQLSCFHFIRVFRAVFGVTPHAYLQLLRVERARGLLSIGMPIARVAVSTGFTDQSHLTRFFKRVYGTTPGVYARAALAR